MVMNINKIKDIIMNDVPQKRRIYLAENGRYYVQEYYFFWQYSERASPIGYSTEQEARDWIKQNSQEPKIIEL